MTAPNALDLVEYLGGEDEVHDQGAALTAFAAEKAAQRSVCNVPTDDGEWPDDLVEALYRRVAHNLALRKLPLAVQQTVTAVGPGTLRVGGTDPEVRRLEAPYRKRKLA